LQLEAVKSRIAAKERTLLEREERLAAREAALQRSVLLQNTTNE